MVYDRKQNTLKYREKNREKINAYSAQYYILNREKIMQKRKEKKEIESKKRQIQILKMYDQMQENLGKLFKNILEKEDNLKNN